MLTQKTRRFYPPVGVVNVIQNAPSSRAGEGTGRTTLASLVGQLHKVLCPHRRDLGGGALRGPGPQWRGHREGEQTLPPLESPSCSGRSKLTLGKQTENSDHNSCQQKGKKVTCRRRHLLRSRSGHFVSLGRFCLLSRYSLVLTCVVCLEIEEEQLYSFRASEG